MRVNLSNDFAAQKDKQQLQQQQNTFKVRSLPVSGLTGDTMIWSQTMGAKTSALDSKEQKIKSKLR